MVDDVETEQKVCCDVCGDGGAESETDREKSVDDAREGRRHRAVVFKREEKHRPEKGREVEPGERHGAEVSADEPAVEERPEEYLLHRRDDERATEELGDRQRPAADMGRVGRRVGRGRFREGPSGKRDPEGADRCAREKSEGDCRQAEAGRVRRGDSAAKNETGDADRQRSGGTDGIARGIRRQRKHQSHPDRKRQDVGKHRFPVLFHARYYSILGQLVVDS